MSPFEGIDFWFSAIYGHIIRVEGGRTETNFFWEGFTSIPTFWVSFSPIGEKADFTILYREVIYDLKNLELINHSNRSQFYQTNSFPNWP